MAENSAGSLMFTISGDASGMIEAANSVQSASNKMVGNLESTTKAAEKAWSAFGSLGGEIQRAAKEASAMSDDSARMSAGLTKSADAVTRVIQQLKLEAATAGMSANTKQLYIAALKGATAAELQEIATLQKLAVVNQQVVTSSGQVTGNFRGMRGAAGQLGYQIQDVAVQLQMGTNAMMVFGQQGSQIASLFGPGGAVIGAIIAIAFAIGSTLVSAIRGASSEFDAMTTKVNELGAAQKQLAVDDVKKKLDDVNQRIETYKKEAESAGSTGLNWNRTVAQVTGNVKVQSAELETLTQEQKKYNDRLKELAGGGTKQLTDANDDWRLSVQAGTIALQEGERKAAIFIRTQETLRKAKEAGLSPEVTQAQIKADTDLINKQFDAQEAHDARAKAQQAATLAGKKDLAAQAQVARQLEDSASKAAQLELEYSNLKKGIDDNSASTSRFTIESARLEAQRQLGAAATEKQIDAQARNILKIHEETEAIAKLKKKQAEDKETTSKFTTIENKVSTKGENVDAQYKEDLKALENYHKMAGASDARYQKTKAKLEEKYRKDKQAAAIEDYKAQSEWNTFLMDGLDALGQSATTTISGLASGTMSATEAMQNFASIILNQAVGALVEMGLNQIKNTMLSNSMAQTQQANIVATNATGIAAGSANASAQAANAATVASAAAPAAAATATFSWGTAAVIGGAALLATYAIAKSAGGRQFGGSVNAGGMYRVGENGRAEVFTQGGRNYLLPGDSGGQVTPMSGLGGGGFSQNVSIVNTSGASVSHNTSADGKQMRILVEQTVSKSISEKRGRIYSAFNRTTNLKSRAR